MYINRIILRGVRSIENLDVTLVNDWTQEPLRSVLLTGPNGSGKTTILEVIAALWEQLPEWSRHPASYYERPDHPLFRDAGMFAIEIHGFQEVPLWLFKGTLDDLADLRALADANQARMIGLDNRILLYPTDDTQWLQDINAELNRLDLGVEQQTHLPNMLYLQAELRSIVQPQTRDEQYAWEPYYRWLAVYKTQTEWQGHLEEMFRNLKVRSPEWFTSVVTQINGFFDGAKRLTDFSRTRYLLVELPNGMSHYVTDLSSGERQCVILIFMVARWLAEGGILLLDEPDLHLHVSLQRQLMYTLKTLVKQKHGQVIVASHSPTLWEEFSDRERIDLGQLQHG